MSEKVDDEGVCMLGKRLGVKWLLLGFFWAVGYFHCDGGFLRDGNAVPLFHRGVGFAYFIPVIGEGDVAVGKIPNAHVNADDVVMLFAPGRCCCCLCLAMLMSEGKSEFRSEKINADACAQVGFCAGRVDAY